MEEKESTISGSLGNSDTDSPPAPVSSNLVLPHQIMNMDMHMNLESTLDSAAKAGATTMTAATVLIPGSGGPGSDSLGKKKRGRPRKYDADGNLRLPAAAAYHQVVTTSPPPPGFTLSPSSPEFSSSKRGRGRPPGSGNWQLLASLGKLLEVFGFFFSSI